MRFSSIAMCVWLGCAACGGAVAEPSQGEPEAGTGVVEGGAIDVSIGPPIVDASVETASGDAANQDAGPISFCGALFQPGASCGVVEECVYEIFVSDGGADWTFSQESLLTDFFRNIAVNSGACATFSTCTYDPLGTEPPDASPSNYVNAQNAFTGPDGYPYVITYFSSSNQWVVVRRDRNPTGYQLLVEYNTCANEGSRTDE